MGFGRDERLNTEEWHAMGRQYQSWLIYDGD